MSHLTPVTGGRFFVSGGTMLGDAPSYVARKADAELYESLLQGEFCYVLTARQMGKSSLMVRTSRRLMEVLQPENGAVALLDLSSVGQNTTEERWYYTLLNVMGKRLGMSTEFSAFWREQTELSPLQRWALALEEVVLKRYSGRVVVFLDEIDMVRSLPFETGELFITLRAFYNRRATEPEFARLTFCLLGVATPSSLIQDTRLTPFNIGTRIELTDFTLEEASVLKQGLAEEEIVGESLLERVLYWTNGHPYLTQRLCQAIVADPLAGKSGTAATVDRHCEALFLASGARDRDSNLLFVRDRVLDKNADVAGNLTLYRHVWSGRRISQVDTRAEDALRLSGIVGTLNRHLTVRNRIYRSVFDSRWITEHMPDAEARRQRVAFQRGVLKTSVVLILLTLVVGIYVLKSFRQAYSISASGGKATETRKTTPPVPEPRQER